MSAKIISLDEYRKRRYVTDENARVISELRTMQHMRRIVARGRPSEEACKNGASQPVVRKGISNEELFDIARNGYKPSC